MMLLRRLLVLLMGVTSFVVAQRVQPAIRPIATLSSANATSSRTLPSTSTPVTLSSVPSSTGGDDSIRLSKDPYTPSGCCFVVQDTMSEEWWNIYTTSTTYGLVNLTSVTTYFSKGPDGVGTIVGSSSSVTVTNTSFLYSYNVGVNPLATWGNLAPGPTEIDSQLTGTATMTGGEVVKSPAAFYVYNSVKIITAEAIYEKGGNVMCGTTSNGFPNINSNAEAYFGGSSIAGNDVSESEYTTVVSTTLTFFEPTSFTTAPTRTATLMNLTTYYTDSDGATVTPPPQQSGFVISLTTPFIYQPPWGETGALQPTPRCHRGSNPAQYGYIPQTLLDFLIQNPAYSAQYPGLKACLPGGPSILFGKCPLLTHYSTTISPLSSTVAIPAGEGLTSSATVYVMPNVVATPGPPDGRLGDTKTSATAAPAQSPPPDNHSNPPPTSTGATINSITGGPAPGGNQFPTQVIGGTQVLVIPGPTTIPLSQAPSGLHGSVTVIGGTTFLSVPSATTLPNPASNPLPNPGGIFASSIVGGSTVLLVPQTTIPLSQAPPGLQGSTTLINNTPYLVISSPTTVPVAAAVVQNTEPILTTTINGIPYLLIPSPTPLQLPGILTTISGTPEVVIAGPTTVPVAELSGLDVSGRTTVIGGVTEVVISGSTTVGVKTGSSGGVSVITTTFVVTTSPAATTKKGNAGARAEIGYLWVGLLGVMVLIYG